MQLQDLLRSRPVFHSDTSAPFLVKVSHACSAHPRGGDMDATSYRVECPSHTAEGHAACLELSWSVLETIDHTDLRDFK